VDFNPLPRPGSPTTPAWRTWPIRGAAREFFVGHVALEQARIGINGDGIAFLHQRDISTHRSFGRGGAPI